VAGLPLSPGATGNYFLCSKYKGVPTMQNLDVVDVFLLAGSLVYFVLLVLRRI
jgi:hypothetical protein